MSTVWIESHSSLRHHPKAKRLARILGVPLLHAIGILHALWWWATDYAEDGDLSRLDAADIGDACDWEDAHTLLDALQGAGFLDADLHIHDWYDYAGRLIHLREDNRERSRERQRRYRERRNALVTRDIPVTNGVSHANVTGPSNAMLQGYQTKPNQTQPDQTKDSVARPRFVPPTPAEVTAFGKTLDFDIDGQHFCDYYEARGWKLGKNTMKSWQACVKTWRRTSTRTPSNGRKPTSTSATERKLCVWKGDRQYRVRERWDAGQGEWQEVEVLEEVAVD